MSDTEQSTAKLIGDQERFQKAREAYSDRLGKSLLGLTAGSFSPIPKALINLGAKLRDGGYQKYPILPGAIGVFQELASTREWTVSGQPQAVSRAVEWINGAISINPITGLPDYGFDSYLKRRALDYNTMGVTMAAASDDLEPGKKIPPLEYIDPVNMSFRRPKGRSRYRNGFIRPVTDEEKCWVYQGSREMKHKDVRHHYPFPIGSRAFVAPIYHLLPTGNLAYLMRESDTAAIDGRKIRDIFLLANPQMEDVIINAMLTQVALWSGADPEDVGYPFVALNGIGTRSVSDMFARIGLADIPEHLKREEFIFMWVNEIAAALGLALRHFWNNEKTTNRALEVVQEQRQQQKGPATFVRTEQRIINNSGWLKRFGSERDSRTRFGFIEETDTASMKDQAEVLKNVATAAGMLIDKLGIYIAPESWIAWLQTKGALPYELELLDVQMPATAESSTGESGDPNIATGESDPQPTTAPVAPADQAKSYKSSDPEDIEYGEITMNGDGQIVAKRLKVYTIKHAVKASMKKTANARPIISLDESGDIEYDDEDTLLDDLTKMIEAEDERNLLVVRALDTKYIAKWSTEQQYFESEAVDLAIKKCKEKSELDPQDRQIIDMLVLDWESVS